jgi:rhodanese-related sulfurtransferase
MQPFLAPVHRMMKSIRQIEKVCDIGHGPTGLLKQTHLIVCHAPPLPALSPCLGERGRVRGTSKEVKRKTAFVLVAALVLALFLACLPARAGERVSPGKVLHLDARGLDLLLQSDPNLLLIDVRTPDELTGPLGKIPQAQNVPMEVLKRNPEQFPRNKTLVLICRSGHRSLDAADLLAEHGYVVYSVDGGMQSWRSLNPQTSAPAGGGSQTEPRDSDRKPGTGKPSPPENGDHQPPDKFFDSNLGC